MGLQMDLQCALACKASRFNNATPVPPVACCGTDKPCTVTSQASCLLRTQLLETSMISGGSQPGSVFQDTIVWVFTTSYGPRALSKDGASIERQTKCKARDDFAPFVTSRWDEPVHAHSGRVLQSLDKRRHDLNFHFAL